MEEACSQPPLTGPESVRAATRAKRSWLLCMLRIERDKDKALRWGMEEYGKGLAVTARSLYIEKFEDEAKSRRRLEL